MGRNTAELKGESKAAFEVVEVIVGIKKPTVKKFKRELAKVRGKGETFE